MLADLKSYKNEINYLSQNIESLQSEVKLHREAKSQTKSEYFTSIRNDIAGPSSSSSSSTSFKPIVDNKYNKMPKYTSTAEFVKTKLVTIPSFESNCIYAVETEGVVEEKSFYQKHEHIESDEKDDENKEKKETKNESKEKAEEFENTLKKAIDNLNEKLEQTTNEKNQLDAQLQKIQAELKTSQKENSLLIDKHEQQVQFLNEQIQTYQVNKSG